ncbi:uncharacterized protein [Coffea arabica]|uniref:Integrase zinc-binding domain-containing protein n=1 Tax=Coffea arabica TaxID=13443 RepID=A0ABM4VQA6_COFAR
MVGEWSLLENVCEWNPRLEPQKVIFGNIEVKSTLLDQIKKCQMKEPTVQKWVERVKKGELPNFNLGSDEILKFRNRVVVPRDEELKREILEESHCSRYMVHPGSGKMYQDLKSLYWWDNMKAKITQFVQKCLTCQQVKAEHKKPSGLLQPLEIPERKWEHITMDFVSELPRIQKGHDAIWKYHPDPTHILPLEDIELDESLAYEERPIRILDRKVKDLRNKQIPLVKVLWKYHEVEEATWELEKNI